MIRFIDLRGQIFNADDIPCHFAFYDTVRARFVTFNGASDWLCWADFVQDSQDSDPTERPSLSDWPNYRAFLDRFKGLLPDWVGKSEAPIVPYRYVAPQRIQPLPCPKQVLPMAPFDMSCWDEHQDDDAVEKAIDRVTRDHRELIEDLAK